MPWRHVLLRLLPKGSIKTCPTTAPCPVSKTGWFPTARYYITFIIILFGIKAVFVLSTCDCCHEDVMWIRSQRAQTRVLCLSRVGCCPGMCAIHTSKEGELRQTSWKERSDLHTKEWRDTKPLSVRYPKCSFLPFLLLFHCNWLPF